MMSQYEFENLVALAEERHAALLALAQQQQLLSDEAPPAHPQDHSVWQWLYHALMDRMRHVHLHWPTMRHSVQHH